jgi:RNA polymerase sigma factor (sigma-70 family)
MTNPDAWVATVTINLARSRFRRLSSERRANRRWRNLNDSHIESVAADIDAGEIREALCSLPERQRAVIVLRFYGELTVDEVAQALRVSAGSVKTHTYRGLQSLRRSLAHLGFEDRSDLGS